MKKLFFTVFLTILMPVLSHSQMVTSTTSTPLQLVNDVLLGGGITATNITYTGATVSRGSFTGGSSISFLIDQGIILTTGDVSQVPGWNTSGMTSYNNSQGGDSDLNALLTGGLTTTNKCVLEFDFVAISDSMSFRYIFASEEYPEFVCGSFNDVFAFFLSGPNPAGGNYVKKNLALIPGTSTYVGVNTINGGVAGSNGNSANCTAIDPNWTSYSGYYNDNPKNANVIQIKPDGYTDVFTAAAKLVCGATYHIKLAIGDVSDADLDSYVFLEAKSFTSQGLTLSTVQQSSQGTLSSGSSASEGCGNVIVTFHPTPVQSTPTTLNYTIGGTASGGSDYTALPGSILVPANADSVNIIISPLTDGITEGAETVTITVSTGTGCSASSNSVTVTINDNTPPVVTLSGNTSLCPGQSTTLTASTAGGSGPYSYQWSNLTGNGNTQTINPASSTVYTVTVTDGCGQTATTSVSVSVGAITANAGNDVSICGGNSTVLNASGGTTYAWSPSTGLSATNISNPTANPSLTTTYTVTVSNGSCSSTDAVVVNISSSIVASAGQDVAICSGSQATLTATGGSSYLWSNGNTNASIQVNPSSTTYYSVTVSENGCTGTDAVQVTVNSMPIADAGNDVTICTGGNATLTANGGSSYLWSNAATNSSISVNPSSTTVYTVTVSSSNCSATDFVTVNVVSSVVADAGQNTVVCSGNSVVLTASGATNYIWSNGISSSSITVNPTTTTTYSVTASNGSCFGTDEVTVTVNPLPIANGGNDITICAGQSTTLNATGGTIYYWSNGSTQSSISISPTTTTTYTVTVTENSCTATDNVLVTVIPIPQTNAGNDVAVCYGSSVTLNVSGGTEYLWSNGNTNSTVTVNPSVTTVYSVTTSESGCSSTDEIMVTVTPTPIANAGSDITICSGQNTILTASGGSTYQWNSGDTNSTLSIFPTATTAYTVTVTENSCSSTDMVLVTVIPLPQTYAGPDAAICSGSSVTLIGSGGSDYIWNTGNTTSSVTVSPAVTTVYTLTTTENGCSSSDVVTITVYPIPVANAGNNATICSGSPAVLTASGGNEYLWSNGATTPSITVAVSNTASFIVTVSQNGCSSTDTVYIYVNPLPVVDAGNDVSICPGDTVQFYGSGGTSCNWTPVVDLSNSTSYSPLCFPDNTTTYSLVVTDANGCKSTDQITVSVYDIPSVIIIASPADNIFVGTSVTFNASSSLTPNTIFWNFGDSNTQQNSTSGETVSHTYNSEGNYTVTLNYQTQEGCSVSTTTEINVFQHSIIDIPNVFTPDGDGKNDNFFPLSSNIENFTMTIYNRWGKVMAVVTDIQHGWDGKSDGSDCADGVYFWIVTYDKMDPTNPGYFINSTERGSVSLLKNK